MDDEASADTSSFLVTIERISRLGILERVRDCFGRKREDVRQIAVRPCPGNSNGRRSRYKLEQKFVR